MSRRVATTLGLLPLAATFALLLWINLSPERIVDFYDFGTPFVEPWYSDAHTAFGWPVLIVRVFDQPSLVNAPGRFDVFALIFDAVVWIVLLSLASVPVFILWLFRRLRHDQRARLTADVREGQ